MPQTIEEVASDIYTLLGDPPVEALPYPHVLTALYDAAQHYINELNITNEGWRFGKLNLTVNADQEEYQITEASFAKAVFVETFDPGNPRMARREVEIVRVQDRDRIPYYGDDVVNVFTAPHTARCFAFYNMQSAEPRVAIQPVPTQQATYRIWYEKLATDPVTIKETFDFLSQFMPLVKAHARCTIIPVLGLKMKWGVDYIGTCLEQASGEKQQYFETFRSHIEMGYHPQSQVQEAANESRRRGRRWL